MGKSIIKLKNVSKFYYNKGVIASGFNKINLEFKMGEFVLICGESGSGKSTLLNVISGLDTYEEGEMYIDGSETSHYGEADFYEYRRKYIGNIFQSFNLINSYSVYQNIELVMLLNGDKKKNIKPRVLELIKKVGLSKFKNTKVSKLSGGQKQRVAIARALAKDTPIIIADEPTGNLDSRSANGIIELLSEIAKDKLVIIVSHNYEQVEKYITRKIKMHDGKILEDRIVKKVNCTKEIEESKYREIRLFSKIRLGIRNSFNIIPKFLLVLGVYLFIIFSLLVEYSAFKEGEMLSESDNYNYYFNDTSLNRVIINKKDRSIISENDYENISKLNNIDCIIYNDLLLDSSVNLVDEDYWIYGYIKDINSFDMKLDYGRMPENDNEIIVVGNSYDYYLEELGEEVLNREVSLSDEYGMDLDYDKLKIVGVSYYEDDDYQDFNIYVSKNLSDVFSYQTNKKYSSFSMMFRDKYFDYVSIKSNSNVNSGEVYIPSDYNYLCKNEKCINENLNLYVSNIYFNDNINLKVNKVYDSKNFNKVLGLDNYDDYYNTIFISNDDYNKLINKGNYQSSIFVSDIDKIDDTVNDLESLGFNTLKISDTLISSGLTQLLKIFKVVVTVILVVVLFFISYFVIRIILKSRNVYFTTIRMLGASKKISRQLLIIELFNVSNLAYLISILLIVINKYKIINVFVIDTILEYLSLSDYILLYIILSVMSYLISMRFSSKLFKRSAITTLSEEV